MPLLRMQHPELDDQLLVPDRKVRRYQKAGWTIVTPEPQPEPQPEPDHHPDTEE